MGEDRFHRTRHTGYSVEVRPEVSMYIVEVPGRRVREMKWCRLVAVLLLISLGSSDGRQLGDENFQQHVRWVQRR